MFLDKEFPAVNSSVFHTKEFRRLLSDKKQLSPLGNVNWKRAREISSQAQLATETNTAKRNFDCAGLSQGHIGNCWFIAAATGLTGNIDLFKKIVPIDNSFSTEEYSGLLN